MGVDGTELAGQAAPWLMGQGREKVSVTVTAWYLSVVIIFVETPWIAA